MSVRSGARKSMPGMMDTVLNIGLNDETIKVLSQKAVTKDLLYDAYRRLVMMYADVVIEKAGGMEPAKGIGIRKIMDERLEEVKKKKGVELDTDLSADDLKN